ncbi:MAG: hypothetical protein RJB66_1415 [Pseudomonadota bacterium]|jgi:hypothetical protein
MKWFLLLSLTVQLALTSFSWAKPHPQNVTTKEVGSKRDNSLKSGISKSAAARHFKTRDGEKTKLQKSIHFNNRVVRGKHQVPGDGSVTVENEKSIFNLISIRTDFNDRRNEEKQRD